MILYRKKMRQSQEFDQNLISLLPKMRGWAMALTRNRAAADDLIQDAASKALAAHASFMPGTNFSAWVHRIMVNHFISGVRGRPAFTDFEDVPEVAVPAAHEDRIALRELGWAMERLPPDQRQALSLVVLEDRSYEDVSDTIGEAVGTLKSRVHRARVQLRSHMMGDRPMITA